MKDKTLNKWLKHKELQGCSLTTREKYRGYILRLFDFLDERGLDIGKVEQDELEKFCGVFLMSQSITHRGRGPVISAVREFFKWFQQSGHRSDNPALQISHPRIGKRLPKFLPLDDLEKIFLEPDLDTFMGVRDAAIIAILSGTGIRLSALCNLNISNLLFVMDNKKERLILKVIDKGDKERILPVPEEARLLIRAYLGHPDLEKIDASLPDSDKVLFVSLRNRNVKPEDYYGENRRLSPRGIQDMLKVYAKRARVDLSLAHPHALRHLYGTELAEEDTQTHHIMTLMGHEKADTSQIYNHTAIRKLTKIVDASNPLKKIKTPVSGMVR